MPGGTAPPYGGWFDEVAGRLGEALAENGLVDAIEKVVVHRGEITFFIRREHLLTAARSLREHPNHAADTHQDADAVGMPVQRGGHPDHQERTDPRGHFRQCDVQRIQGAQARTVGGGSGRGHRHLRLARGRWRIFGAVATRRSDEPKGPAASATMTGPFHPTRHS